MRRRDFIAGLGSAAAWTRAVHAQQPAMPVVGLIGSYLGAGDPYLPAFLRGLSQTGHIEGQNVAIDYHWIEGQNQRLPSIVRDLVSRRVAVRSAAALLGDYPGRPLTAGFASPDTASKDRLALVTSGTLSGTHRRVVRGRKFHPYRCPWHAKILRFETAPPPRR
jgi:putative ABC transport system substrate-binding protein